VDVKERSRVCKEADAVEANVKLLRRENRRLGTEPSRSKILLDSEFTLLRSVSGKISTSPVLAGCTGVGITTWLPPPSSCSCLDGSLACMSLTSHGESSDMSGKGPIVVSELLSLCPVVENSAEEYRTLSSGAGSGSLYRRCGGVVEGDKTSVHSQLEHVDCLSSARNVGLCSGEGGMICVDRFGGHSVLNTVR
jgi:hypothetical protein